MRLERITQNQIGPDQLRPLLSCSAAFIEARRQTGDHLVDHLGLLGVNRRRPAVLCHGKTLLRRRKPGLVTLGQGQGGVPGTDRFRVTPLARQFGRQVKARQDMLWIA